jgi:mitochondrial fission protein ELM1
MSAAVWLLYDGKVGLRSQVVGVAEAVGLPFEEKKLSIRYPWKGLPPLLWWNATAAAARPGDRLTPPWPRLVIAAGGRSAAPALAIRRKNHGRTVVVQIQDPKLPPARFDLMIVADHDKVRGPNVMVSLGAVHPVTPTKLAAAAAQWAPRLAHLPHPRIAVVIGGDNGVYRLTPEVTTRIADQLAALVRDGAGLMITTSRRTGAEAEAILRTRLAGPQVEIWSGTGDNPYFGYLGLADHILVTADSVSMITEASASGKPVHVLPLEGGSKKFERFHQAMQAAGITRPFDGSLQSWDYRPQDDTGAAGARIRQIMQDRGLWPA